MIDALDRRALDRIADPALRRRTERALAATVRCPACHESGEVWEGSGGDSVGVVTCWRCRGEGRVSRFANDAERERDARFVARVMEVGP